MYKLLPILLFAFILANSSNYDKEIQDWIDEQMKDSYEELNLGLDRNLYLITMEYEVLDKQALLIHKATLEKHHNSVNFPCILEWRELC